MPLYQLSLAPQTHGAQRILPCFTEHLQCRLSLFHSHLAFRDISVVTTVDDGFPSTQNRKFNATTLSANSLHWPYIRTPQHRRKHSPFFMKLHSNLCPIWHKRAQPVIPRHHTSESNLFLSTSTLIKYWKLTRYCNSVRMQLIPG